METKHKHNFASIVLAAGKGVRMRSELPKVMHKLAGKPMISHVLACLNPLSPQKTVVVIAPGMESVQKAASLEMPGCGFAIQAKQQGTGHAVLCAQPQLENFAGTVLVLYGDTPLITPATLLRMLEVARSAEIVVLGMQLADPTGYGRLVVDNNGQLEEIVECKDTQPGQKEITLCNSGVMAISGKHLFSLLKQIKPDNAAGEYYLTDIVTLADEHNLHCHVVVADAQELMGINSREQLAKAEKTLQRRLRKKIMDAGATLVDPDSVQLSADTKIGTDVVVHPHVVFGPDVVVENGAEIRSFCHIEGARIGKNAIVGPFARLRPGAIIGEGAHVGNFVEIKNASLGKDAKANHLSYVGDASVGEGANIGAGTITCNYDGAQKHKTTIGDFAFIGSNASLVAPVTIGEGAVVGAGSVITEDVEPGALAIERSPQVNKPARGKQAKRKKS